MPHFSRRQFLKIGICAAVSLGIPQLASASIPVKSLSFYHLHTGEKLKVAYAEYGQYIPSAMQELNHFLRDWRTGDTHHIDPKLLDQLYTLQQRMETHTPFDVICGYRSPKTNQMLHEQTEGVATHSLHLEGRAIDVRLPGKDLSRLHRAALSMQAGGVGYYPSSDFIHIDTGRLRHWG